MSKPRVRILMVSMSYYPADPRIRREIETLEENGMQVDILCLRGAKERKRENLGGTEIYRILKGREKESLLQYLWLSTLFIGLAFFANLWLSMRRSYGLLQVHNLPDYLVFLGIVQKFRGVPVVLDLHDLMIELFEAKWTGKKSRRLLPLLRFTESACCRFADRLVTTSSGFRQRLLERGVPEKKITLVLNSADHRIFVNGKARTFKPIAERARLLYHGTVAERFGLEYLISAVAALQSQVPGTTLRIYGKYDSSYRRRLEEMVARLDIADLIFWGDYLSLEAISAVIEESDLGVVPYKSDSFMDLALSTKTFEYVAMELPVVASRLPSLQTIFDESCIHYVNPESVPELTERIVELCRKPELRTVGVRNASRAYRPISWPIMAERYLKLIREELN